MNHLGTCSLKTSRLILRRFKIDDAAAMYSSWCSDPEVTRFMAWSPHEGEDYTKTLLMDWIKQYDNSDVYNWAITLGEDGDDPIGAISVTRINAEIEAVEIGYCIGKKWWNRGITSEALECVIAFLFSEVGVNRIEAKHDIRNPGSGRVMQKCGMKFEGTMREAGRNNQGLCDEALYGILKKD